MILRTLLLFLAFVPFTVSLQAGIWDNITGYFKGQTRPEPPTIRVLLFHDVEGANLEVRGKYSLFDPYTNGHLSTRTTGKSRYIQTLGDGLKWGEAFPGLYQLKIKPDDNSGSTIVNGREYDGLMFVYDIGGTVSIVNEIPVEEYVRSILANFQNQNLEPETMAALAIAARTNAYCQAANPKNTYWAVDAEKVGYQGRVPGSYLVDDAVKSTRYMIMSHTGVYEGVATPFGVQFQEASGTPTKDFETSKITLQEADEMAKRGEHAAQILAKAFPGTTIMLMKYSN